MTEPERAELGAARRHWRRWRAPLACALAVFVITGAIAVPRTPQFHTAIPGRIPPAVPESTNIKPTATAPVPTVEYPNDAPAASQHLRALSTGLVADGTDGPAGRYAYVRLRIWKPAQAGQIVFYEERRWRTADGSGRVTTIRPPGVTDGPQPATVDYPPGALRGAVSEPLSAYPPALAGQLNSIYPWSSGSQSGIRAAADLYSWHHPTRDVRAVLLEVLSDVDGLLWRGRALDRAGRPAVAVSVDSAGGTVRDTAFFDPHTGKLLAHHSIWLNRPHRLIRYVLVLANTRADQPA